MFLDFLMRWLHYRYVKQTEEVRTFHQDEVPLIPDGYYAVVSVELKPVGGSVPIAEELAVHA